MQNNEGTEVVNIAAVTLDEVLKLINKPSANVQIEKTKLESIISYFNR